MCVEEGLSFIAAGTSFYVRGGRVRQTWSDAETRFEMTLFFGLFHGSLTNIKVDHFSIDNRKTIFFGCLFNLIILATFFHPLKLLLTAFYFI